MNTKRFFLGAMFALMVAGGSLLLNGCTEDLFGGGDDNNDNQGSVRNEMTMGGRTLAIDGMDVDEDDDILTLRLYNVSQQVSVYFEFPGTFNGSNGTHSYTITNPAGKSSPVYCTIETPAGITMVVSGEVTMNILGDHKGTLEASGRTDDGTEVRLSYSTENSNGGNNGGNNNGGNGDHPSSMANTGSWMYQDGQVMYNLTFGSGDMCVFTKSSMTGDSYDNYYGRYTYSSSNGNGNIVFYDEEMTHQVCSANFEVHGNTLHMNFQGQDITLTHNDGGNGGGGNGGVNDYPESMSGSHWTLRETIDGELLTYSLTFGTACYLTVTSVTSDGQRESARFTGDYTYSSGTGSINFYDDTMSQIVETSPFTVSGEVLEMVFRNRNLRLTRNND